MSKILFRLIGAALAGQFLISCAAVEFGGKIARKAGETLTGYSKENDGVVGRAAGVAGGVYTTAGTVAEDSAKSGKTGQATDTNKQAAATSSAVASKDGSQGSVVAKAQKRLTELGYDAGTPNGVLGPKTTDAIGQFQASRGLRVTKTLDQPTLTALGIPGRS